MTINDIKIRVICLSTRVLADNALNEILSLFILDATHNIQYDSLLDYVLKLEASVKHSVIQHHINADMTECTMIILDSVDADKMYYQIIMKRL